MQRRLSVYLSAILANLFLITLAAAQTTAPQAIAPEATPPQATPAQATPAPPPPAQTTAIQTPDQPSPNAVSDQFKSGANNLGSGFAQVGEGIKQGAILTWQSIVAGVSTTTSHLEGTDNTPHPSQ